MIITTWQGWIWIQYSSWDLSVEVHSLQARSTNFGREINQVTSCYWIQLDTLYSPFRLYICYNRTCAKMFESYEASQMCHERKNKGEIWPPTDSNIFLNKLSFDRYYGFNFSNTLLKKIPKDVNLCFSAFSDFFLLKIFDCEYQEDG